MSEIFIDCPYDDILRDHTGKEYLDFMEGEGKNFFMIAFTFRINRIAALCWFVSWTQRGSSSSSAHYVKIILLFQYPSTSSLHVEENEREKRNRINKTASSWLLANAKWQILTKSIWLYRYSRCCVLFQFSLFTFNSIFNLLSLKAFQCTIFIEFNLYLILSRLTPDFVVNLASNGFYNLD